MTQENAFRRFLNLGYTRLVSITPPGCDVSPNSSLAKRQRDLGKAPGILGRDRMPLDILQECLRLEPETGLLYWKQRPRRHFPSDRTWLAFLGQYAGREAFTYVGDNGYKQSNINAAGKRYRLYAHDVVWALHTGRWPVCTLDHRDTVRTNNVPSNLREATYGQQAANRPVMRTNQTGLKGVIPSGRKFVAQIRIDGVRTHLGTFETAEAAHRAYIAAAQKHYGEFARA